MDLKSILSQLSDAAKGVSPYAYAGAIRAATTRGVEALRDQAIARVPSEHASAAVAFLATDAGDALLRLALAGLVSGIPKAQRPTVLSDVRDELLISCAESSVYAASDALLEFGKHAYERVSAIVRVAGEGQSC